jgi:hypothetical protein
MGVRTSGVRQQSIWASVVSDNAIRLRDWLLALGFTEDLMIPGDGEGLVHHAQLDWPEGGRVLLSSTGERGTPCRPGSSSVHVVTSDPDGVLERALSLDAASCTHWSTRLTTPRATLRWPTPTAAIGPSWLRGLGAEQPRARIADRLHDETRRRRRGRRS